MQGMEEEEVEREEVEMREVKEVGAVEEMGMDNQQKEILKWRWSTRPRM